MSDDKTIGGIPLNALNEWSLRERSSNEALAKRLSTHRDEEVDDKVNTFHQMEFEQINCLNCANCCKTTPALIVPEDISRISQALKMTRGSFIRKYVTMDEDGDFVINHTPCPFLDVSNACTIYDVRPEACRAYPLTNGRGQKKILAISLENTGVCPAVFNIFKRLNEVFPT